MNSGPRCSRCAKRCAGGAGRVLTVCAQGKCGNPSGSSHLSRPNLANIEPMFVQIGPMLVQILSMLGRTRPKFPRLRRKLSNSANALPESATFGCHRSISTELGKQTVDIGESNQIEQRPKSSVEVQCFGLNRPNVRRSWPEGDQSIGPDLVESVQHLVEVRPTLSELRFRLPFQLACLLLEREA